MQVFSRKTTRGQQIECTIDETNGRFDFAFQLDGQAIRKGSVVGVETVDDMVSDNVQIQGFKDALVAAGAVAHWNYQVGLFSGEPELMAAALEEAEARHLAREISDIEQSGLIVTELTGTGTPGVIQNAAYTWHWYTDTVVCRKTKKALAGKQAPTSQGEAAEFFRIVCLIVKHHKVEKRAEPENVELRALEGLSRTEIAQKRAAYDVLHNEGGEGYNPYDIG